MLDSSSVLNDLELTILALVAEGPRYGSEVEQTIQARGMREWLKVGSSSTYYILDKLQKQELLSSNVDDSGQTIYTLAEAGHGVLQTAVADLISQPRPLGTGVELGLANLSVLKPAQVYQVMVHRRIALEQQLQSTEQVWERHQQETSVADQTRALYTHGIATMRAELNWLEDYIQDWRRRYPAVERDDNPDAISKPTQIHHRTAPLNPAKHVQRLQRPNEAE
jgi:DNA-binding PadR family transcriptional regulator